MSIKKSILPLTSTALLVLFTLLPSSAQAREGYFELKSTTSAPNRCSIFSALLDDRKYHLLTTCREIRFPAGSEVITYYAWGTPVNGGDPIKFGSIGTGKADFSTSTPFINIYITQETAPSKEVKSPRGPIVMQGGLQTLRFLDGPTSQDEPVENELGDPVSEGEEEPKPQTESKSRISRLLATSSVFAFIGLFVLIFFLFLITRR